MEKQGQTRREFMKSSAVLTATGIVASSLHSNGETETLSLKRPSTYFLQEAVDLGFQAVSGRLDRQEEYRPFFGLHLRPEPRLEHAVWDYGDMCSRYLDAFILGRQMTGNEEFAKEEKALRAQLHTKCDPYAHPFMATRMLITYVDEYLQDKSAENRKRVHDLAALIKSKMTFENDYAYFFKPPEGWSSVEKPVFGQFTPYPTYPIGGIVLALTRYLESEDSPELEDLNKRLCRFILDVSGTFDSEGRFKGHTHSGGILTAAAGLMRWGVLTGDKSVVERMKKAFDWSKRYSSSWGWVPDGLGSEGASSESCAITDALHLGILAARHVDPSYYEVVERYSRNQFLENQFKNPDRALPEGEFPQREAVSKALKGSWASWSTPNSLDNCLKFVEGCCLGSGIRGCFLAWESSIEKRNDTVFVHMAFSRNSPWVEVVSYMPYEGKVEILVHDASSVAMRIPSWVSGRQMKAAVGDRTVNAGLCPKRYARIDGLKKGDVVKIEFPLLKRGIPESVYGLGEYTVRWRGDTVTGISPKGELYPIFERDSMEQDTAPLLASNPYDVQTGGPVHW